LTGRRDKRHAAKPFLIVLLAAVIALMTAFAGCGGDSAPAVQTRYGKVEGQADSRGTMAFKGIPYAKPPVKDLRFKPPQPPQPWSGIYQAIMFGPVAPQTEEDVASTGGQKQSEDCLYLNVWTRGTTGKRRPVMVWIHGGGFTNGSGSEDWYNGATFAERGDVVVVTVNYRLGALGFLYLDRRGGAAYAGSGNLGMLDQVAALEWVRDNIASFGGDPGNVTVFGESAGGMSVCTLMGMPAAKGLFRRAIAESGAVSMVRGADYASRITDRFMARAGVSDVSGLLSLSTDKIIEAQGDLLSNEAASGTPLGPTIDGSVLTEPPLHAIANGSAAGVDFMSGTNMDEVRFWLMQVPQLAIAPLQSAMAFMPELQQAVGGNAQAIAASYGSRRPGATDGDVTIAITTDVMFRVPAIRIAEAQSALNARTYMYLFTWPSPVHDGILRSCHALELPFVWNVLHSSRSVELLGADPPQKLADAMQDSWLAFARTGDPNSENDAGAPKWTAYDGSGRSTMILNVDPAMQNDPNGQDRALWDGIPFDSVSPSP